MKSLSYMTRAMRAKDRRYVKILGKLGYGVATDEPELKPAPKPKNGKSKRRRHDPADGE